MQALAKAKKGATKMKPLTKSLRTKFFGLCFNAGKAVLAKMVEAERTIRAADMPRFNSPNPHAEWASDSAFAAGIATSA
jgi:hypothetical protein